MFIIPEFADKMKDFGQMKWMVINDQDNKDFEDFNIREWIENKFEFNP